jgi:hypothetical protein
MEATPPNGQPFPLNEPGGMPFNQSTDTAEKIASLQKAIAFPGSTNFGLGHSTIGGLPWFTADGHVSSFYTFSR